MYKVVWPRGRRTSPLVDCADRLPTLQNATVAELWDWWFRGDLVFPLLEKKLAERYPGIKFVSYEVFGSTHSADEAKVIASLRDKLQENKCDAVISGIGC